MPNTTLNTCEIKGPKEHIDMLLKDMTHSNDDIRLSYAYPQPYIYMGLHSGNITINNESHNVWRYDTRVSSMDDIQNATPIAMSDEEIQSIIDEHGTVDPIEWQYQNWGTKWGDYNTIVERIDDEQINVAFTSAWKEPDLLLHEISMKYSVIIINTFELEFDDGVYHTVYPIKEKEVQWLKNLHKDMRDALQKMGEMMTKDMKNNPDKSKKPFEIIKNIIIDAPFGPVTITELEEE